MPKYINPKRKAVSKNKPHIRWNIEMPYYKEDYTEEYQRLTYYFVIVDNKNREATMNKIVKYLREWGEVEREIHEEGKVKNSRMKYLFESYKSNQKPEMIQWGNIMIPSIQDKNLLRTAKGKGSMSVEDRVRNFYYS